MQQWYYADGGERQGPVAAQTIADLFRRGRLRRDTLVWRDGLPEWQALGQHLDELGLAQPPAPPPSPVASPASAPRPAAPAAAPAENPFAPPKAPPRDSHGTEGYAAATDAPVVQAGFVRRWLALIVDSLVIALPLLVLLFVFVGLGALAMDDETAALVQVGYYGLYLLVAPLYYAGLESSASQATLGKRLLGIKVVDMEGRRLSFGRALGRWFAAALSYITFYIGFLMAAFTERKQALHDFIASTQVVDRWAYTDHPERQKTGLSGCLIAIVLVLLLGVPLIGILAAIAIPAYADYTGRAQTASAIAAASPAKLAVAEYWFSNERCPDDWSQLEGNPQPQSEYLERSEVGAYQEDGECGIALTFGHRADSRLVGGQVWLSMNPQGNWTCSGSIDSRLLPASCR